MKIQITKSMITGGWGYCPAEAATMLVPEFSAEANFKTADEAIAAAKADRTVPKGAEFVIVGAEAR